MIKNDPSVSDLQTYLRLIASHEDGILAPPVDGIFDTATEQSVTDYQAKRGLPASGKVDEELWNLIYDEFCDLQKQDCTALPVPLFPCTPNAVLRLGCKDFAVATVRYLLSELHNSHASIPVLPLSDDFDADTQSAVLTFQKLHHLPETGSVDKITWDLLVEDYCCLE